MGFEFSVGAETFLLSDPY